MSLKQERGSRSALLYSPRMEFGAFGVVSRIGKAKIHIRIPLGLTRNEQRITRAGAMFQLTGDPKYLAIFREICDSDPEAKRKLDALFGRGAALSQLLTPSGSKR